MSRYIDTKYLFKCETCSSYTGDKCYTYCDHGESYYPNMTKIPTADVVEVRHGKWYQHNKKKHGDTCYHCSVCENYALSDCMVWELTDYCPHCGAKMDGERSKK